jgi:hypothetical protein
MPAMADEEGSFRGSSAMVVDMICLYAPKAGYRLQREGAAELLVKRDMATLIARASPNRMPYVFSRSGKIGKRR